MTKYDIFLSYQWDIQDKIKEFYTQLTSLGLSVWMDIHKMAGGKLHSEIVEGIQNSKVFICCITKKYSESKNCENELCFAYDTNKKIIAVMFEKVTLSELKGVGLILARLLRINAYTDAKFPSDNNSERFVELLTAIKAELPEYVKISKSESQSSNRSLRDIFKDKKKENKNNNNNNNNSLLENKNSENDSQEIYYNNTIFPTVCAYPNQNMYQNMYQVANQLRNVNHGLYPLGQTQQSDGVLGTLKEKFKSITGKISSNISTTTNQNQLFPYGSVYPYQYQNF